MTPKPSLKRTVRIANPQGLHMRPAAAFAELASRYRVDVRVWRGEKDVDGKSLWDLIMLAAGPGDEVIVEVAGQDAYEALPALSELLAAIPEEVEN